MSQNSGGWSREGQSWQRVRHAQSLKAPQGAEAGSAMCPRHKDHEGGEALPEECSLSRVGGEDPGAGSELSWGQRVGKT